MKTRLFTGIMISLTFTLLAVACTTGQVSPTSLNKTSLPTQETLVTQTGTAILPSQTLPLPVTETSNPVPQAERIPIIEYHNPSFKLNDQVMMTSAWFDDQIRWLAENGYKTLNASELVSFLDGGSFPQRSVVISFDIGVEHRSEYADIVIPTLRKYKMTAIVFLLVNSNLVKDTCSQGEIYCWSELKAWADEGLISVESHGMWHTDYKTLDAASQREDAGGAKEIIEEKIGHPVLGFAYPYDSYTSQTVGILKSLGYQFAVGGFTRNDRSVYLGDSSRYLLPRVYPYSNPAIYPKLASGEASFPQMIQDQTSLIGLPTPTPSIEQNTANTPVSTVTLQSLNTPDPNMVSVTTPSEYKAMCALIDQTSDAVLRLYQLNHLVFPSDLSQSTVAQLPAPIRIVSSCNIRPTNQPRAIVLHFTRGPLLSAISTFQKLNNTSAHYIIDRDGTVVQLLPEALGAFHVSCYGTRSNCVASCPICEDANGKFVEPATQSIGIELVNQGQVLPASFKGPIFEDYQMSFNYRYWEDYPEAQIKSLILLVNDIRQRWNIPLDMVIGHYRINNNADPGPALNLFWDRYGNPPRPAIFPTN